MKYSKLHREKELLNVHYICEFILVQAKKTGVYAFFASVTVIVTLQFFLLHYSRCVCVLCVAQTGAQLRTKQ